MIFLSLNIIYIVMQEMLEKYHLSQVLLSLIGLAVYLLLAKLISKRVLSRGELLGFHMTRSNFTSRAIKFGFIILLMIWLGVVWDISFKGISVYLVSIFTVVGVGLFANWSMVSNITASVILFFFFPFKVGSKVRIIDGGSSVEGEVLNVSVFSVTILNEAGEEVYVPNNVILQKSTAEIKSVKKNEVHK